MLNKEKKAKISYLNSGMEQWKSTIMKLHFPKLA